MNTQRLKLLLDLFNREPKMPKPDSHDLEILAARGLIVAAPRAKNRWFTTVKGDIVVQGMFRLLAGEQITV